jgi:hypothetical protein
VYPQLCQPHSPPIDYAALPRRARTFFSTTLRHWNDLADESIASLMSRTGVGIGTTQALLAALDRRFASAIAGGTTGQTWGPPQLSDQPPPPPVQSEDMILLRRWASWRRSSALQTLGDLVSAEQGFLPDDVAAARDRLLATAVVDASAPRPAASELLDEWRATVDERALGILDRRVWAADPERLQTIADELGVTRERVRQIQERSHRALMSSAGTREALSWLVHEVCHALGAVTTAGSTDALLLELELDPADCRSRALLDLAGPYERTGGLVHLAGDTLARLVGEVRALTTTDGGTDEDSLLLLLEQHDVKAEVFDELIEHLAGCRIVEGRWRRWTGSVIDKAAVILDAAGGPMTAEEINSAIDEGHSFRTVLNGMSQDPRFVRTSRRTWGLASWGLEEYSGIAEEILERIDRDGGSTEVEPLVTELVSTFEVSENSVRMYLGTIAFVVEAGRVRRRTPTDPWPIDTAVAHAAGTYRTGDEVRLALPVTTDMLRGSGRLVHPAAATALGVLPGSKRPFRTGTDTAVVVGWRPWSTTGPDAGSVRHLAEKTHAAIGDTLVVVFDVGSETASAVAVPAAAEPDAVIEALIGGAPTADVVAAMGRAIGAERGDVDQTLRTRGDARVADLLAAMTDDPPPGLMEAPS